MQKRKPVKRRQYYFDMTIQLIHPKHGLVDTKIVPAMSQRKPAIEKWRSIYGQKFYECDIVTVKKNEVEDADLVSSRPAPDHTNKNFWQ